MATLSNLSSTVDSNYFDLYKSEQAINTFIAKGNIKFDKNAKTFVDLGYPYSSTTGSRTGPLVAFRSVDYTDAPGDIQFFVPTTDNSTYYNLNLSNKGTLKWRNQEVERLSATYRSGSTWYRVYADGTIMQGGICNATQYNNTSVNVTFPKAFSNTNYIALANPNTPDHQGTWSINARCAVKTTTGMSVHGANNVNSAFTGATAWIAIGN